MININNLKKLTMTEELIAKHNSSSYFSGRQKVNGDQFLLGCLIIPDYPDLQVVADIPLQDIEEGYYELSHINVNGASRLGFFKIKRFSTTMEEHLIDIFEKYQIEYKLEQMKAKIEEEIRINKEEN